MLVCLDGRNDLTAPFARGGGSAPYGPRPPAGSDGQPPPVSPRFENRDEQLDEVYFAVMDAHGEHFWLLIASPQLGKSWLLHRIAERVVPRNRPGGWVAHWVDVRHLPPEVAEDADAIMLRMLGQRRNDGAGPASVDDIADDIVNDGMFRLCLLDSAELLSDPTIYTLRQRLGAINADVARAGSANARLAVIAASRRDRGWKGVDPTRPPRILRLNGFSVGVIQKALEKLASNAGRASTPELHEHAVRVHRLSEGLPALLTGCLSWTSAHWRELSVLDDWGTFVEIARPYVQDGLLSPDSLSGSGPMLTPGQQEAVRQTLLLLSPYRLLTESHLSDLADRGELPDVLTRLGWSAHDLWNTVSGTDLLYRSDNGIWLTIDPPIRRLLSRYRFPSEADRGHAHGAARDFLQRFTAKQEGSDWARMFVECLWHEAQSLILLGHRAELEASLTGLARDLVAQLTRGDSSYRAELCRYAVECMKADQELTATLREIPGLLDRLAQAVERSRQEYP